MEYNFTTKCNSLTEIVLRNFKGIGNRPVRVPIRRLTLLFGENSAGKSTILHSLFYIDTILSGYNYGTEHYQRERTKPANLDIGNFEQLVNQHDTSKKIFMQFKFNTSVYIEETNYESELSVSLEISQDPKDKYVGINATTIEIDGKVISHSVSSGISYFDTTHEIFEPERENLVNFLKSNPEFFRIEEDRVYYTRLGDSLSPLAEIKGFSRFTDKIKPHEKEIVAFLQNSLAKLYSDTLNAMKEYLGPQRVSHIGPLRALPAREFKLKRNEKYTWYNGMKAWEMMYSSIKTKPDGSINNGWIDYLNEYLEILDIGYRLALKENVVDRGDEFSQKSGNSLIIVDEKGLQLTVNDIGVGVSQVLPVIVGIADENVSFLAVEQPELHLHPRLQCNLADVFIYGLNNYLYNTYLIETHSEHFLLRLMRRIRENTEFMKLIRTNKENPERLKKLNEKYNNDLLLTNEEVGVLYIHEVDGETVITELPIDEEGEFTKEWPKGFFEERFDETFGQF